MVCLIKVYLKISDIVKCDNLLQYPVLAFSHYIFKTTVITIIVSTARSIYRFYVMLSENRSTPSETKLDKIGQN